MTNPLFTAAFATELATIERVTTAPTTTDLGSDLSCVDDVDELMTELSEDDPLLVAQALARSITTQRGSLLDDLNYGIDIAESLSVASTAQDRAAIAGRIRGEAAKDDRILDITVTLDDTTDENRTIAVEISGTTETGPFRLVMALTDGELLVQEMTAE